jgi:site-specific DNA-methyltransferase (adenine-specific)
MIEINNIEELKNKIFNEDCISENLNEGMNRIPDKSIDMILCDLPYQKTEMSWDTIIPFNKLWKQYERIIKDNGAIILFGNQPFTSMLIMSNLKLFKYCLVWNKEICGSFAMAKLRPMIIHEDICVFSKGTTANGSKRNMIYNPILKDAEEKNIRPVNQGSSFSNATFGERSSQRMAKSDKNYNPKKRYPKSIFTYSKYNAECNQLKRLHSTQKPVELLKWLISMYSNENNIILDNCCGSGSTAIASINTNRNYILFDNGKCDKKGDNYSRYWADISQERINTYLENKIL